MFGNISTALCISIQSVILSHLKQIGGQADVESDKRPLWQLLHHHRLSCPTERLNHVLHRQHIFKEWPNLFGKSTEWLLSRYAFQNMSYWICTDLSWSERPDARKPSLCKFSCFPPRGFWQLAHFSARWDITSNSADSVGRENSPGTKRYSVTSQ